MQRPPPGGLLLPRLLVPSLDAVQNSRDLVELGPKAKKMSRPKIPTQALPPPPTVDLPFLVSPSELRNRKSERRRKQDVGLRRSEAIRPVDLGPKSKR
jgi:hypothetical protein